MRFLVIASLKRFKQISNRSQPTAKQPQTADDDTGTPRHKKGRHRNRGQPARWIILELVNSRIW